MKKFLLLGTIFVATGALAFGGIGIGPWQRHKNQGVDAIGIHIDPNGKKADIDIVDDDSQEEVCADGILKDRFGKCNICENGKVYLSYLDKPCNHETETTGCSSNIQCNADEYCVLNSSLTEGVCSPLQEGEIFIYKGHEFFGKWLGFINWWSSENWCKAYGKKMLTLADVGVDKSKLGPCYEENGRCNDPSNPIAVVENSCATDVVDWEDIYQVFCNQTSCYWWLNEFRNIDGNFYTNVMPVPNQGLYRFQPSNQGPTGGAICK